MNIRMLTANLAKYTYNDVHRDFLLSTGTKRIVDGSPYDIVWGVGVAFSDPRVDDKDNWRGDNLLSDVLMTTRRILLPRSLIPRKLRTPAGASGAVLTPTAIESVPDVKCPKCTKFDPTNHISARHLVLVHQIWTKLGMDIQLDHLNKAVQEFIVYRKIKDGRRGSKVQNRPNLTPIMTFRLLIRISIITFGQNLA